MNQNEPKLTVAKISPHPIDPSALEALDIIGRQRNKAIESTNFVAEFHHANLADNLAKGILSKIEKFDEELDPEREVGINLVSFGQTVTLHVSGIGYYNPSLIIFYGLTDNGDRVELIQHISQISFLLIALPRLEPTLPKKKIGFIQPEPS